MHPVAEMAWRVGQRGVGSAPVRRHARSVSAEAAASAATDLIVVLRSRGLPVSTEAARTVPLAAAVLTGMLGGRVRPAAVAAYLVANVTGHPVPRPDRDRAAGTGPSATRGEPSHVRRR